MGRVDYWDLSDQGPANTYSSSRMGLYEDGTVKMACSSSKMGVFEEGGGDSWELALRAE